MRISTQKRYHTYFSMAETNPETLTKVEDKEEKATTPEKKDSSVQENPQPAVQLETKVNEMASKILTLENDLQLRTEERENYKNKIHSLETEIAEMKKNQSNTLSPTQQNEVEKIKKVSEEVLTKAKGVIFDKTKVIKNQELQIEALKQQVESLKEVLSITKDLLEIRNMEVKHLEEKMEHMDEKIKSEKQRHDLMHQKLDTMVQMNSSLKGEYETQLKLFSDLRANYAEREELKKTADSLK
ncbi:uncharacterized protein CBL_04912 [Carabus blaptoides fortunei]